MKSPNVLVYIGELYCPRKFLDTNIKINYLHLHCQPNCCGHTYFFLSMHHVTHFKAILHLITRTKIWWIMPAVSNITWKLHCIICLFNSVFTLPPMSISYSCVISWGYCFFNYALIPMNPAILGKSTGSPIRLFVRHLLHSTYNKLPSQICEGVNKDCLSAGYFKWLSITHC